MRHLKSSTGTKREKCGPVYAQRGEDEAFSLRSFPKQKVFQRPRRLKGELQASKFGKRGGFFTWNKRWRCGMPIFRPKPILYRKETGICSLFQSLGPFPLAFCLHSHKDVVRREKLPCVAQT